MARKKKKSEAYYIGQGFKYLGLGIYHTARGGYLATRWIIRKAKENKVELIKKEANKSTTKHDSLKELKKINGDLKKFEEKLHNSNSLIGIILGARGKGKSAIGMRFLENFKEKTTKKVYAIGFKKETLPSWIKSISSISELENDSIILIDEGGIEFSSRSSMSPANKLLSELLLISRHKDTTVLFITQNSSNLEINALRQADFLILKPSSLLQLDFERKKIKDIYKEAEEHFEKLKNDLGLTYIYSDQYKGFVSNSLPSFWSEKISKSYSKA